MKNRKWIFLTFAVILLISVFVWLLTPETFSIKQASTWQRLANPGDLSAAHASLKNNCIACHTPVKGVEPANCIVCHANNISLLKNQTTSFHANINSCKECHLEHLGRDRFPTNMDHSILAIIGLRQLKGGDNQKSENEQTRRQLMSWINRADETSLPHLKITPLELLLNCVSCHSNRDPHFGFFGNNCASCHSTHMWTIPEFRHPPEISKDCAQCHKAPPGHYMEMFEMMRSEMLGKRHVRIEQCFECHKITSWSDIKGLPRHKSMHSPER